VVTGPACYKNSPFGGGASTQIADLHSPPLRRFMMPCRRSRLAASSCSAANSASRSCSNCTKSAGNTTRPSRSRVNMERKWTVRISMSQSKDEIRTRARAEVRDLLELQLAPLGRPALDALAAGPTAHILDIGCGGGTTMLEIAKSVRPTGAVCGIDVSASVLAYAKAAAEGCERVRNGEADAQTYPFEQHHFDGAFSRFGLMFFADPVAAFSNISHPSLRNTRMLRARSRLLTRLTRNILECRTSPELVGGFRCGPKEPLAQTRLR
jgi:hypothetical protein